METKGGCLGNRLSARHAGEYSSRLSRRDLGVDCIAVKAVLSARGRSSRQSSNHCRAEVKRSTVSEFAGAEYLKSLEIAMIDVVGRTKVLFG